MAGEIELAYMVEVKNPDGYANATSVEMHDQYEYRLPNDASGRRRGKIRIRKTVKNNQTSFEECIKVPLNPGSLLGDDEQVTTVSEAYFETWRRVFAADGFKKVRYTFVTMDATMAYNGEEIKLPPVKFEVDVFIDKSGKRSKWAKVDIEVQDIVSMLKEKYPDVDAAKFEIKFDALPIEVGQVVSMATKNSDERAAIENFFKHYAIPYEAPDAGKNNPDPAA